jgi:DNA repair exonuclease SbcCD ATPase subunit
MIVFKKIRWKNFLSTGNIFTEIELNKSATTLIVGENGAGKSTLLDALSFALFNKPFRKINKPLLLNSITKKDLVVEIEFSIGSNNYKIVRGIKPNIFEVYQNGSLLNQSADSKDYQDILEKQILKINFKSFCQVVVLGSASFVPFMSLPAGQRREIIEDLLDLQIFTSMNAILKQKIVTNAEDLIKQEANKTIIEEKMKLVKKHLIEIQNNNEKIISEKNERKEQTNIQINELDDEYWKLENKRKDLEEKIVDEKELASSMKKLTALKHKFEAHLSSQKEQIKFFTDHDNCPTCKQEIDETFKCDMVQSNQERVKELEDNLEVVAKNYVETNDKINEMMNIQTEINNTKMDIHKISTKISSLIEYRTQLENEINTIQKNVREDNSDQLNKLVDELKEAEDVLCELHDLKQTYQAVSVLLKDGGIKAKIIKQYIPIINKLINKYLSSMDFFVQFELNEEFNETIKSRFRDEFSYASFSEGEKMRINLAILFTWRAVAKLRNSISTNILIMDEVMDSSLDSNGTEEFMKVLTQLAIDTNTFIISHKTDQFYDKFTSVIKFEKHKNFSKVAA